VNVPNVYEELEQRNPNQMSKIISAASIVIISSFFFAGVFGYATFMQDPGQLCSENVLQASGYSNQNMIQMGSIALVFCVASGFPICMIPCKNSIEELFFKGRRMTTLENVFVTFLLANFCCCLALFVPDIGTAMTIVGSTVNPIIAFILPVLLYWPYIEHKPLFSLDKIAAISTVIFMLFIMVFSFINFFTPQDSKDIDNPNTC
jgi:amino acid permease